MALVKVGRAGKVTLPAPIRRQLAIAEDDRLDAEGGVLLRRPADAARRAAWARIREAQRSVR